MRLYPNKLRGQSIRTRCHPVRGAHKCVSARGRSGELPRYPKVSELDTPVTADEYIGSLNIPVEVSARMEVIQTLENLTGNHENILLLKAAVANLSARYYIFEPHEGRDMDSAINTKSAQAPPVQYSITIHKSVFTM